MKVKIKLPELERRDTGLFDAEAGVKLGKPELREDKAFPKIAGYAAVFDVLSEPLFWGVREKIRAGAFKRTLAEGADVRALVDHNPQMILGRNKAGTLRLYEDDHGLHYEIDPPETTVGRDTIVSLRRKDVDQSSFGFRVKEEEYNIKGDVVTRELIDVDLFDVSIVTYPAYPQTSVSVRSLWPNMEEASAKLSMEAWFRSIKETLAPPRMLPQFERRLRQKRLDLIGRSIDAQKEVDAPKRHVQLVTFSRSDKPGGSWTPERAKGWLRDHGFSSDRMDTKDLTYSFRQFEVSLGKDGTFAFVADNLPRGVRALTCERAEVVA